MPVDGTTKMLISFPRVSAESSEEAGREANGIVRTVIPENGYVVSDPSAVEDVLEAAGQ